MAASLQPGGRAAPRWPTTAAGAVWRGWLAQAALLLGLSAGLGLAAAVQPVLVLAAIAGLLLFAWLLARPVRTAYLFALLVPIVVGVSRGAMVPVLRPNEALIVLGLGIAVLYATCGPRDGAVRFGPWTSIDRAFGLLFVGGSVWPLAVLLFRSDTPTAEDAFQLLSLLKLYLGYRLVLAVVHSAPQRLVVVRLLLVASVAVAVIGLLQIARVGDVHELLARYYSAGQVRDALEVRRATSTLGVWQALGAYLAVHAALALLLLATPAARGRWRGFLVVAAACNIVGSLATTTLTAALALCIALGAVALFTRQVQRTLLIGLAVIALSAVVLWPAIEERWTYQFYQYGTVLDMPVSWEGRLTNLTQVFWPLVRENLLFGVAPSVDPNLPWLYAENQVMYLLYQGGLPYAAAYFIFMGVVLRALWRFTRRLQGGDLAAARAGFIAWLLVFVLGVLDTHLNMPGEAETAWTLLALTVGAVHGERPA
jgi:hypothetical protein